MAFRLCLVESFTLLLFIMDTSSLVNELRLFADVLTRAANQLGASALSAPEAYTDVTAAMVRYQQHGQPALKMARSLINVRLNSRSPEQSVQTPVEAADGI